MEFIFCSVFDQTVFGDLHMCSVNIGSYKLLINGVKRHVGRFKVLINLMFISHK
jgi:hypothetical protein